MRRQEEDAQSLEGLGMVARNLMFFVYPRNNGQKWRRAVRHLKARWGQFTGHKAVAIALDNTCDPPEEVAAEFGDDSIAYHLCQNTELQEVQPFVWLLEQAKDRPGITLYAHAKGSTHVADGAASHIWCDAMAEACLDYPGLVDCMLQRYATCGAFRSFMPVGHSPAPWHFAGTWWWAKNDALFSRNWGHVEQVFWGVESYPGIQFALHESGCLFFDHAQTAQLYSPEWWRAYINPALADWRKRLAGCGLSPLCPDPPVMR